MNPFSILGQLAASNSPAWSFNLLDAKKIGREVVVALAPIGVEVLTSISGHRVVIGGTDYTVYAAGASWLLLQILRRFIAGQPKAA